MQTSLPILSLLDPVAGRGVNGGQPPATGGRSDQVPASLPPPPVVRTAITDDALQARLRRAQLQPARDDGDSLRSRSAIKAYQTLDLTDEREAISRLLGFDGYA